MDVGGEGGEGRETVYSETAREGEGEEKPEQRKERRVG